MGHLQNLGLRVQQEKVAKTLVRMDPTNSDLRWAALIKRRKYSLWHIDGDHSLVNWGFVIHGGIDGFSRSIVSSNALQITERKLLVDCLRKQFQSLETHFEFEMVKVVKM